MLHMTLLGGLGDIIDQTDPCTLNPADPICQATAADTAADPCKVNPNASYCQAAVVQQGSALPTPGSDTSAWSSFFNVPTQPPPIVTSLPPRTVRPAAVSMASLVPNKTAMIVLGVIGLLAFAVHRHRQMSAAL